VLSYGLPLALFHHPDDPSSVGPLPHSLPRMFLDRILKLAQGLWIYAISFSVVLKLAGTVQVSAMLLKAAIADNRDTKDRVVFIWAAYFGTSECWEHEGIQQLIPSRSLFRHVQISADNQLERRPLFLGQGSLLWIHRLLRSKPHYQPPFSALTFV
jgi:hypothetical protein